MTKIEWANPPGFKGESWNPVTGCSPISPGCENCWARRMAYRQRGRNGYPMDDSFRPGVLHENKWAELVTWRKPRCIFVVSMGDLFHEDVPTQLIQEVLDLADDLPHHRYLLLTKRPTRMRDVLCKWYEGDTFPKNLALGVSVEDQQHADERIPLLLQCPAVMRFVSVEPMLGPVELCQCHKFRRPSPTAHDIATCGLYTGLSWVIIGCESGPKRRECDWHWQRDLLGQCQDAGVPAFVKQVIMPRNRVSHDPAEWPMYLRVRQWPEFLWPPNKKDK